GWASAVQGLVGILKSVKGGMSLLGLSLLCPTKLEAWHGISTLQKVVSSISFKPSSQLSPLIAAGHETGFYQQAVLQITPKQIIPKVA
ncbi:MAG: hypothetical protein N2515_01265, partial [Deltaproteobacteria bacterium]|nr:hypothetical protein [Deltaproteobacteria bacterium]